jgi:hypothetical protein
MTLRGDRSGLTLQSSRCLIGLIHSEKSRRSFSLVQRENMERVSQQKRETAVPMREEQGLDPTAKVA